MLNKEELLELLKTNKREFNEYVDMKSKRNELRNIVPIKLDKVNLKRMDLTGVNFTAVDLMYSDLSFSNLTNANLTRTNLNLATLFGAKLNNVTFNRTTLLGTDLTYCELDKPAYEYITKTWFKWRLNGIKT